MEKFSKEALDSMSIWQLRDYARKLGHASPASKKKGELVDYILERYEVTGGVEVAQPEKKRGRPPKPVVNLQDYQAMTKGTYRAPQKEHPEHSPKPEYQPRQEYNQMRRDPERRMVNDAARERSRESYYNSTNNYQRNNYNNDYQYGGNSYNDRNNNYNDRNNNYNDRNSNYNDRNNNYNDRNNNYNDRNNSYNDRSNSYNERNNSYNDRNNNYTENNIEEAAPGVVEIREGVLEICPDGFGFLRAKNYEQGDRDAYIAAPKIRKSGLRRGDYVVATVKKLADNRPWNVQEIESVNGLSPQEAFNRRSFDTLTPIYPDSRLKLELANAKNDFAIRSIDLVAPIGKGQRGMIVSPPKAGKTTLLKKIAHSITANYPDAHLIVLLIDERPEEVTDMQRSIQGEVVYSTFDEMPEHHTKAAEMVLERAKRLTELGKDVVILMDSLTRLARAYNLVITPTGKTLSGGIDPGALHNPKRFFGAARNIENGGSLTIIATALVDTGSRMDDVIYEEFKGTGNMEIHLDRKLSEKRIFPAIDLNRSGTRREELLLDQKELEGIWAVRKMLSAGDVQEATENLIAMMVKTANNKEFIEQLSLQIMKLQKDGYIIR